MSRHCCYHRHRRLGCRPRQRVSSKVQGAVEAVDLTNVENLEDKEAWAGRKHLVSSPLIPVDGWIYIYGCIVIVLIPETQYLPTYPYQHAELLHPSIPQFVLNPGHAPARRFRATRGILVELDTSDYLLPVSMSPPTCCTALYQHACGSNAS